jgi:hypothetical protein
MALVVLPEGQQRSGKQGGMVWSRNRTGPYVRNRAIPVNPNTPRQAMLRASLAFIQARFRQTLTDAQRANWETYALNTPMPGRMGGVIVVTGANMYARVNVVLIQAGLAPADDAPTIFDTGVPEQSLVVTGSEATQFLSVGYDDTGDWCDEDGSCQAVYMGLPQNPTRNFFGGPWRFAGSIDGDSVSPPTTPASIAAPFGFAQGQKVWVYSIIARADGRLSARAVDTFLGAA